MPLALARELAARSREQLARGIDPIDARKAAALAQRAARARQTTFKVCAEEYHAANVTRWTNARHRSEWISAMRRFAFPVIGHLSVDMIDSAHVQAGHVTAPDQCCRTVRKSLPGRRPHVTQSGHLPATHVAVAKLLQAPIKLSD